MGFMACSRRLDQTGMYLKNEYSVFKGHPDFRPYKISLTRILLFRVGLVGALWLSLQDYLRFVLTILVSYAAGLGQKIPRWFPNEAHDCCCALTRFRSHLKQKQPAYHVVHSTQYAGYSFHLLLVPQHTIFQFNKFPIKDFLQHLPAW